MRLLRILDAAAVLCSLAVLSSLVYWWWRPEDLFLYAALFPSITVSRHLTLKTHALDLG